MVDARVVELVGGGEVCWRLLPSTAPSVPGGRGWGPGAGVLLVAAGGAVCLLHRHQLRRTARQCLRWLLRLLEEEGSDKGGLATTPPTLPRQAVNKRLLEVKKMGGMQSSTPNSPLITSLALTESMKEMVTNARSVRRLIWEASFFSTDADYSLHLDSTQTQEGLEGAECASLTESYNSLSLLHQSIGARMDLWHLAPGSAPLVDGTFNFDNVSLQLGDLEWDDWAGGGPLSPASTCSLESGYAGSEPTSAPTSPSPPPSPPSPLELHPPCEL